jgi:ribosomal protein S18 acetylase RimI-like enzyme
MLNLITVSTNEQYNTTKNLFREYAAWLNIDLCFQNFEDELLHIEDMYAPPKGVIYLAAIENEFIGCVAVRDKQNNIAELKRLYVNENYRGQGVGKALFDKAIEFAQNASYEKIRLDTLSNMDIAINLYKANGFFEIAPYYHNPESNAVFFEKTL